MNPLAALRSPDSVLQGPYFWAQTPPNKEQKKFALDPSPSLKKIPAQAVRADNEEILKDVTATAGNLNLDTSASLVQTDWKEGSVFEKPKTASAVLRKKGRTNARGMQINRTRPLTQNRALRNNETRRSRGEDGGSTASPQNSEMAAKIQSWWRMMVVKRNYIKLLLALPLLSSKTRQVMISKLLGRGQRVWSSRRTTAMVKSKQVQQQISVQERSEACVTLQAWWRMRVTRFNYRKLSLTMALLPSKTKENMLSKLHGPKLFGSKAKCYLKFTASNSVRL